MRRCPLLWPVTGKKYLQVSITLAGSNPTKLVAVTTAHVSNYVFAFAEDAKINKAELYPRKEISC